MQLSDDSETCITRCFSDVTVQLNQSSTAI